MSVALKQIVENIAKLSSDEKALVAHCLTSSLDDQQDENVDQAWAELVQTRITEIQSGEVQGVSWGEIKNRVTG